MGRLHALWFAWLTVWAAGQAVYGAVAPWAVAGTALATAVLLGLSLVLFPGGLPLSRATLVFLAAAASVFALQLLPLGFLFPATAALHVQLRTDSPFLGTADAFLTLRVLAQFASYLASGLLVLKLRREGLGSASLLQGICAVLLVQAAYALVQQAAGLQSLPFYGPRTTTDAASGTLVSRNTFAGMMAMGAVAAAALATSSFFARRRDSGLGWALAAGFFLVGLVLSKSRGGSVGAVVGLLVLPLLHRGRGSFGAALAVLAACLLGVCLADPSLLAGRFTELGDQDLRGDTRWRIWTSTVSAGLHQPLLGFGVGTHPTAYHPYQPVDLAGQVHHAHNEYVNFFFEGGLVWLLTLTAAFGVWAWRTWSSSQRLPGPDRIFPAAAIAAACAEAAHSMVDFDLRVTSAGLLFAALIGLGGSAQRAKSEPKTLPSGLVAAVAAISGLLLLLLPLDSDATANAAAASDPERAAKLCREALRRSPYNYRAAWILARATDDPDGFAAAGDLWPAHAELQKDVGLYFWRKGDRARAAICLRRLFQQRPQEVEPVMKELWSKDRSPADDEALLPETPSAWGAYAGFIVAKGKWREGLDAFRRGVPPVPANAGVYDAFAERLTSAGQWGMAAAVLDQRLKVKSDPRAQAASARAWAKLEAWDRALEAATIARRTDPMNVEWILLEADLRRSDHQLEKALEALMEGLRRAPLDVGLRMKRAALYVEMKLWTSAADDYKAALRSRPGDREATLGLAQALAASGDSAGARKILEDHLRRNPADEAARLLLDR